MKWLLNKFVPPAGTPIKEWTLRWIRNIFSVCLVSGIMSIAILAGIQEWKNMIIAIALLTGVTASLAWIHWDTERR